MFPVLLSIGPVTVTSFGVMLVWALSLGGFVFWQKAREENFDETETFDVLLGTIIWSVLAARLLFVLINFDDFGLNVWYWLSFWNKPGFYWPGLLMGAGWYIWKICRQKKWEVFKVLDLIVYGGSLTQALINLGVFLDGSSIGRVTSLPVGVLFPGLSEKRHPVGLYAGILWLLGFWLLGWLEARYRKFEWYQRYRGDAREGFITFSYVIMLGVIGLILALFSESNSGGTLVSVEIFLRVGLIIMGVVGLFVRSGLRGGTGQKTPWLNWKK